MNGYFDNGFGNWLPSDPEVIFTTEDGVDVGSGDIVYEFDNIGVYFHDEDECFNWAKYWYGNEFGHEDEIWEEITKVEVSSIF